MYSSSTASLKRKAKWVSSSAVAIWKFWMISSLNMYHILGGKLEGPREQTSEQRWHLFHPCPLFPADPSAQSIIDALGTQKSGGQNMWELSKTQKVCKVTVLMTELGGKTTDSLGRLKMMTCPKPATHLAGFMASCSCSRWHSQEILPPEFMLLISILYCSSI